MEIKESSLPNAGRGVFTTKQFGIGTIFGPYEGKKVPPDVDRTTIDTTYMWEV